MTGGNRPGAGETLLDHTGHFIADAEAATRALTALGFNVTPFSAQVVPDPNGGAPQLTGTGNVCVMLGEGYLEFLVHTADTPLGLEFKTALAERAGLHLCAFAVPDAAARHAALISGGHPMRPLVHFSKEVATQTGTAEASFTVARLQAGVMEEGRVQVLTHHSVDAMWQPRWLTHDNGATTLKSIVISAPDVAETAARYAAFLGVAAVKQGRGAWLQLSRGAVEILPEAEARDVIGQTVAPGTSAFAGLRIGVRDLTRLDALRPPGMERTPDGALRVPFGPALGRGAFLFEAA